MNRGKNTGMKHVSVTAKKSWSLVFLVSFSWVCVDNTLMWACWVMGVHLVDVNPAEQSETEYKNMGSSIWIGLKLQVDKHATFQLVYILKYLKTTEPLLRSWTWIRHFVVLDGNTSVHPVSCFESFRQCFCHDRFQIRCYKLSESQSLSTEHTMIEE